ncbi:MAG TPA: nucleoid occlusion protein [Syntrophomonas sp.]|jgi:ParB family chromosome partitioning protein|nr:nucleoid occlusion protein [Syntrophomonas sp.]
MTGKGQQKVVEQIPAELIRPNPYQPRQQFDEEELFKLAQSIRAYGLIQPIVVRSVEGEYQIIAGERRFRACRMLGMERIPAIVQNMNDQNAAAVSLIENIQRRELNYFEEANAYSLLINNFDMTQEDLARKIGKSQSAIANKLRLLKLPLEVQSLIVPDMLSERHARALLKLNSPELQIAAIKQIYEQELTVKETEKLVQDLSKNNMPRESEAKPGGQQVSMIIHDARIFINTIKETVRRARQIGVEIQIEEEDGEDEYRINIRIGKVRKPRRMSGGF